MLAPLRSTTYNCRTWSETSYYRDNAERCFDSPETDEEDLSNFKMFMKLCPELKQVLRSFNGDADLLKRFITHVSIHILISLCVLLNHYPQLTSAACNARAEDSSSCRKATREYVGLVSKMSSRFLIEKKCDRGWNNAYTARLLCPLKYLEEFDENPQYVIGLVPMTY